MRRPGPTALLGALAAITAGAAAGSCHHDEAQAPPPVRYFDATLDDTRFRVAEHMRASIEMQVSGEPFAQLLGRNLAGFDRFNTTTDLYVGADGKAVVDPLGYVTSIETYEYSKQPMNNLSFESGAGLSLAFGPALNPTALVEDDAFRLLRDRIQQFADASHSGGPPGVAFVVSPAPVNNPLNCYGWPGIWPQFAEFRSFDSAVRPAQGATHGCTLVGGYAAAAAGQQVVGDYECGSVSLNLPSRDTQAEKVLAPAGLGYALWKQMLWAINYWQSMHDVDGNPIIEVDAADLGSVGVAGNTVIGRYPDPADPSGQKLIPGSAGTYLGDIPIEGFQGLVMLEEARNKAALLLGQLLTTDGATLGGFASTQEALDYDYTAPLRWWPTAVAVSEMPGRGTPGAAVKYFPQPIAYTIADGASTLGDLSGLLGGEAEWFATTDARNADVGGLSSWGATYDGDPFAADNGLPDGEDTPHDHALAILKVALVDLDRLHFDPTAQVLVDSATVAGGQVKRGTTVTTVDAAYAIVALRTALRSLSGTLALYSNDTPDTLGIPTALDGTKLDGAPAGGGIAARALALLRAQADFLSSHLVGDDGSVANAYDLAAGARDGSPARLEAPMAAIRGLLEAYLATSDEKYRQRAILVHGAVESRYWMDAVHAYRTTEAQDDPLVYTPTTVATMDGALRQYWKLVARRPGSEDVATALLDRFVRMNKLVLNGFDDANRDGLVKFPDECTGAGLQMGERALTGELGHPADGPDRDHDCVPEISAIKRPAALAAQLTLKRHP